MKRLHRHLKHRKLQPHSEHTIPAILIVALLLIGLAALIGRDVPVIMQQVSGRPAARPTPAALAHVYRMGDTAVQPGYELTVTMVRHDAVGTPPFVPGTGYEYYIVDLRIKNTSTMPLQIAPVVQTYLRDAGGNTYNMAPAPMERPYNAGPLAPGEERAGQISFNVLQNAIRPQFIFDTDQPDSAPTSIRLGD
jgi:hypothetical protein